jgi:hypothetical protein
MILGKSEIIENYDPAFAGISILRRIDKRIQDLINEYIECCHSNGIYPL